VPIAAIMLATVGVLGYFLLVRHVMKGPMLAQILGTFGLALLLRYSAFSAEGIAPDACAHYFRRRLASPTPHRASAPCEGLTC
jgi:branched-subunit amino acid ABC-type transport system permease component